MLFAFWCLYNYGSDGWLELRRRLSHAMETDHFWASLERSVDYFGLPELGQVLERFRRLDAALIEEPGDRITELDAELARLRPSALHQVAERVRRQPSDFIETEG